MMIISEWGTKENVSNTSLSLHYTKARHQRVHLKHKSIITLYQSQTPESTSQTQVYHYIIPKRDTKEYISNTSLSLHYTRARRHRVHLEHKYIITSPFSHDSDSSVSSWQHHTKSACNTFPSTDPRSVSMRKGSLSLSTHLFIALQHADRLSPLELDSNFSTSAWISLAFVTFPIWAK